MLRNVVVVTILVFMIGKYQIAHAETVLSSGDIAFTAFNADGDKDFAIVALKEIPANTTLYFTDNEPNEDGSGFLDFHEGTLTWETGESNIGEGSIIIFSDIENDENSNFGASIGTLTTSTFDAGINPSASGDELYAVEGSPNGDHINTWLAGIQNSNGCEGEYFNKTGLVMDSTFINFYSSANPDGGYYSGSRTSESSFSNYLTLLGDNSNWTTHNTDGESLLPISSDGFSVESSLPIELSSWTAKTKNGLVELSWTTESEVENMGFIIERSILQQNQDIGKFNVIASYKTHKKCIGQGSTAESHQYIFQDNDINIELSYCYRLSDVNYSGKITRHAIRFATTIKDELITPQTIEITNLYPNPFNPSIQIELQLYKNSQDLNISIFDVNGLFVKRLYLGDRQKGVAHFIWNGTNELEENIPSGVYLVDVLSESFHQTRRVTLIR